jgi:cyclic beta-1,2-glucan synthetase
MPASFYHQLPILAAGPLAGLPRAYDISQRLVAGSAGRLDLDYARRFVEFYQVESPLTMGELWALPVMLRLSLVHLLASELSSITGVPPPPSLPGLPLAGQSTPDELVGNCFTSLRAIATHDWKRFFEAVSRVEAVLREDPAGIYGHMDRETRDQYRKAVEKLAIEARCDEERVARNAVALAGHASASFDSAERDRPLGSAQEAIASLGQHGPPDYAQDTIAAPEPDWMAQPRAHVGYYLIDSGLIELQETLGVPRRRRGQSAAAARFGPGHRVAHPTRLYLGSIWLVATLLVLGGLAIGRAWGATAWQEALILVLSVVPALTIAVSVVDWLVTLLVPPNILPKLDFDTGIPDAFKTLVVVPSLLASEDDVRALLEQLEVYYLGNPDPNLSFALLVDPPDASTKETPDDRGLLEQAWDGIRELNVRYGRVGVIGAPRRSPVVSSTGPVTLAAPGDNGGPPKSALPRGRTPFFLFYRERRWNELEGRWMAWERKRGKLQELNRWLRGASDTSFVAVEGAVDDLDGVRYVITLDADTILPRDAALRMVATIAHPLNRAVADGHSGRVARGYGILQPRTEITPKTANATFFSRAASGDTGLDLYSRAVSNVYQDLFGTGIYVGKGIYDVDAFERSLAGRVPENRLLSHDLFEGIHARAGLVTDIVVYEDYPTSYLGYIRRLRRWTRGDWQLVPWLLPHRPPADRRAPLETFPLIDGWKLVDNLRRSLLPLGLLLFLASAWLITTRRDPPLAARDRLPALRGARARSGDRRDADAGVRDATRAAGVDDGRRNCATGGFRLAAEVPMDHHGIFRGSLRLACGARRSLPGFAAARRRAPPHRLADRA